MDLCLEALSALTGCRVEASAAESQLMPQDVVNIAALKQFYRREGLQELEYPSLGSLSLGGPDDEDMYSAPLAVEGPPPPEPLEGPPIKINPATFFDPRFDYDFTNVKVLTREPFTSGVFVCACVCVCVCVRLDLVYSTGFRRGVSGCGGPLNRRTPNPPRPNDAEV